MYSINYVLTGQQAVTATAASLAILPTAGARIVTIKAMKANTASVFIGPSGVTASTGFELAPGDSRDLYVSTPDDLYVVAAATGSSVSWIVQF